MSGTCKVTTYSHEHFYAQKFEKINKLTKSNLPNFLSIFTICLTYL